MRYFSIILGVGELFLRITENGYISLRELEDQCKVNLRFMWIANTLYIDGSKFEANANKYS